MAPLLVLLPATGAVDAPSSEVEITLRLVAPAGPTSRPASPDLLPMQRTLQDARVDLPRQVSIEQRVTIRVSPRQAPMAMAPALFEQDDGSSGARYVERKFGKCLPLAGIVGVQPVSGRKLLLIMRDDRLFTAELEKGCQARDFYSGFLVAKSVDGMICKERDELRARSGATCQVSGFRQIVELGV